MTAISGVIPNLIGGVEQRPPEIRALNTAKYLNNVWLSPKIGMTTRSNTRYIGKMAGTPGADDFIKPHTISKPSGNYQVTFVDGALEVMDLSTGTNKTVNVTKNVTASLEGATAISDGTAYQVDLLPSQTTIEVVISGITTATVLIEQSSTGAFAGEETTVATKTADETFDLTVTDGYYYRAAVSAYTAGTIDVDFQTSPYDYLRAGGNAQNIGLLTIGDTTFLYNRAVTVTATTTDESGVSGITEGGTARLNPNHHGTCWFKQRSTVNDFFTIYINNTKVAEYNSDSQLRNAVAALTAQITGAEATSATQIGDSVISIEFLSENDWVNTDGPEGSQTFFNDYVDEFADLTKHDVEGRLVLVRQDSGESADDYWVWYKAGAWEETYGWNSYEQLDAHTMPVALVDNLDGTFTLQEWTWGGRTCGDTDSAPSPSFIGNTINRMFLYKGRMVVLADENFVASEVSNFENFYRTTATQLLDDDPIDVASPESRGAQLRHAIEFNDELLMFTKFDQFAISGDSEGLLSPNTVDIAKKNAYNCAENVTPVLAGPNILFADDFGNSPYAQILEYQVERLFGRQVALPITDSVPEYIPTGVYRIVNGISQNLALVLTEGARDTIYAYQYYYTQEGKVQASWSKWSMPGDVYGAEFLEDDLIVTMLINGELVVSRIVFEIGLDLTIDDDSVLMDLRVHSDDLTVTYSGGNTTVTLPYKADYTTQKLVVSPSDVAGVLQPGTVVTPDSDDDSYTLTFAGVDLSGTNFLVGVPYTLNWTPNPIYLRDEKGVPIQDGRLQLRYFSILYSMCNNFTVTVTPPQRTATATDLTTTARDSKAKAFSGIQVGNAETVIGETNFVNGEFRVAAYGPAEQVLIEIEAPTPWRATFSSVEWDGAWRGKRKRT